MIKSGGEEERGWGAREAGEREAGRGFGDGGGRSYNPAAQHVYRAVLPTH